MISAEDSYKVEVQSGDEYWVEHRFDYWRDGLRITTDVTQGYVIISHQSIVLSTAQADALREFLVSQTTEKET